MKKPMRHTKDYTGYVNSDLLNKLQQQNAELIEALKHSKDCIESLGSQLSKYHEPAWQYQSTLKSIEQAIKKAEG